MSRLDDIFAPLRAAKTPALMPFVCAGSPAPGALGAMLAGCRRAGAPIVEVGFPYSDPVADGPVIAQAMFRALEAGMTTAMVFDEVAAYRAEEASESGAIRDPMVRDMLGGSTAPLGLVAMVSYSIVHKLGGPTDFCRRATQAGFDGLIVPDLPLEESPALAAAARLSGMSLSMLIAPTTPPARAAAIVKECTGFVYLLARAGTTGAQAETPDVGPRIAALRKMTDLPIVVGFGVSTPEQVRGVMAHADGVIVGSALVRALEGAGADPGRAAESFVRSLQPR